MERLTFNWYPDYESEKTVKPNVTVLNFGDDYEQRQAKGLNRIKEEWSLTFTRSYDVINAVDDFLTARAAVESFYWTNPRGQKDGCGVRQPYCEALSGLSRSHCDLPTNL